MCKQLEQVAVIIAHLIAVHYFKTQFTEARNAGAIDVPEARNLEVHVVRCWNEVAPVSVEFREA